MKAWVVGKNGMLAQSFASVLKDQAVYSGKELDLFDGKQVERWIDTHKPTHLINCAAYTHVDSAEREKEAAYQANVELPRRLALLAKRCRLPLLHFSTDYVFDGAKSSPYRAEDPTNPLNVYGATKLKGEEAILEVMPHACIVRTSWLYGDTGAPFPWKVIEKLKKGVTLHMIDDQYGAPTYTRDLVDVALQLKDHGGIFHMANRGATTWYHYTLCIAEWLKKRGHIESFDVRPVTSSAYAADAKRPKYSVFCLDPVESILHGEIREWEVALMDYLERVDDRLET